MTLYMLNQSSNTVTEFPRDDDARAALSVMRRMRWVKVKRYGRKGNRRYVVTLRNRQEWKHGYIMTAEGHRARIK